MLNVSKTEVSRALREKLQLQFREGKEQNGWFVLEGRKVLRVTMPKGRGNLPGGTANSIREQVKLSNQDFKDLVNCPLTGKAYGAIIKDKVAQGLR